MNMVFLLLTVISAQSPVYEANNRNCYSVGVYFDEVINPLLGEGAWPSDTARKLSNRGNKALDKWLKRQLANNTEQFKQKFENPSEDDQSLQAFIELKESCEDLIEDYEDEQRLGKPHTSHTSGSYVASKDFGEVVRQSSKFNRNNITWFGKEFGQSLEGQVAPFCKKYYDRSLFDPVCGKAYSFIANDRTAKQVCKQFANKSSFEIQKTYKNTDDKYGEEVFSYEGGKEWVLRNYKDAVVQIYTIACY